MQKQPTNHIDFFAPKILWLIIGVLMFVVVVGSIAWWEEMKKQSSYSPSVRELEEMANWKTHTDTELGFEFRYPSDWKVEASSELDTRNFMVSVADEKLRGFNVFSVDVTKNISLNSWIQKNEPKNPDGGTLVTKKSDITFLGLPAKEWIVFRFDHNTREIVFEKDKSVFHIKYEKEDPNIENFEDYLKASEQVLSTFKFTGLSTFNWKTYTNTEYGFEFKYPNNWSVKNENGGVGLTGPELAELQANNEIEIRAFDIGIFIKNTNQSADDYSKNIDKGWYESYKSKTKIKIDSRDAIKYSDVDAKVAHFPLIAIFIQDKNRIVQIHMEYGDDAERQIFDQILSTFKFVDTRILLTPENISKYNDEYLHDGSLEFNFDDPDTTVRYTNKERGLSFDVPFNEKWGNVKFKISPFDEAKNSIVFGALGAFEAGAWGRTDYLIFKPARSAEQIMDELHATFGDESNPDWVPKKVTINRLDVVEYFDPGLCPGNMVEVVGKKYNYHLESCFVNDFKHYEELIKTFKLVD
jgi:hypothetical protein